MSIRNKKYDVKPTHVKQPANPYGILPAPGILESYEEISEGSVEKILDFVKSEQNHRHRLENKKVNGALTNEKIKMIMIFALAIIITYSSIAFVMSENILISVLMLIAGFGFLSIYVNSGGKSFKSSGKNWNKGRGHRAANKPSGNRKSTHNRAGK